MNRNMDLVRDILIVFYDGGGLNDPRLSDRYDKESVYCNFDLCKDAGFIDDKYKLTWAGFEFVAKYKDDTTWNRISKVLKYNGISASMFAIDVFYESILRDEIII